jgi:hypothetical protein
MADLAPVNTFLRTVRTRCLGQCRGDYLPSVPYPYLPSLCSRRLTSLINAVLLLSTYFESGGEPHAKRSQAFFVQFWFGGTRIL